MGDRGGATANTSPRARAFASAPGAARALLTRYGPDDRVREAFARAWARYSRVQIGGRPGSSDPAGTPVRRPPGRAIGTGKT